MGMAASQARYLGLAARRTNVEYQGQQINQSRLALANQSAELWNQMLGLTVPTVPDTQDFVKTQYSFSDGANGYEITSLVPTDYKDDVTGVEYNYAVTYRYMEQEVQGIEKTNTNPQVQKAFSKGTTDFAITAGTPSTIQVNGATVEGTTTTVGALSADEKATLIRAGFIDESTADTETITKFGNDHYAVGAAAVANELVGNYQLGNDTVKLVDLNDPTIRTSLAKIMENNPGTEMATAIQNALKETDPVNEIYTFVKAGTTYFSCKDGLEASYASGTRPSADPHTLSGIDGQDSLRQYYTASVEVTRETTDYAIMDDASGSGRFSSIKLSGFSKPFNLNTESTKDDIGYENALNQYYYDVQQYEKAQSDINAKTEKIQQQDRTLELRLKQLDTEHTALQTEMEAVKKIISKNVEETFKTFGG